LTSQTKSILAPLFLHPLFAHVEYCCTDTTKKSLDLKIDFITKIKTA
jgi:hypothetical protein